MAEFKMPKYVWKDKPLSLDECYRELSDLSYQSPVEVMYKGFQTKLEGDIMTAIQEYGVIVDKDELVKALKYDRNQYEKGFIDGCNGAFAEIKAEVAREIFAELDKFIVTKVINYGTINYDIGDKYKELKKKYIGGSENE